MDQPQVEIDAQEKHDVLTDMGLLFKYMAARDYKWTRSINRFLQNGDRLEGLKTLYGAPMAYVFQGYDADTGLLPCINVGRSIALTLQSKIIQTKGRLFLNPVNGLWSTIKLCRNGQIYFDAFVDRDNLTDKAKRIVLDALIFEIGVLLVDPDTKSTSRVKPWEYFIDPAEYNYGQVSRCMIRHEEYPLSAVPRAMEYSNLKAELEMNPHRKVIYYRYWDLKKKRYYAAVGFESTFVDVRDIEYERPPVALYFWEDPIKGIWSTSVMDNSYQNQRQIDDILYRIHDALTLSPANTIYYPQSATDETVGKIMSNKVGNMVPFNSALGLPVVATPPPIDASYTNLLDYFVRSTYEAEGVSQLSAQSKKPAGITAGVALDTLQDVESERFQAKVDNFIQWWRDVYQTMIDVFPGGDEILPSRVNRASVKWSEIKKQRELFSLQTSLASVLSKEPETKLKQIVQLQAAGVLSQGMATSLMELPDTEGAFAVATASYDNCRKIIERAIDDNRFDFQPYVNLRQLLEESVNVLLQLDSVDEDPKIIERLVKLIEKVSQTMNDVKNVQNPAAPPPPPPAIPLEQTALAGHQMNAIVAAITAKSKGEMTPQELVAFVNLVAPALPMDQVNILAGIPPGPPVGPDGLPLPIPVPEAPAPSPIPPGPPVPEVAPV